MQDRPLAPDRPLVPDRPFAPDRPLMPDRPLTPDRPLMALSPFCDDSAASSDRFASSSSAPQPTRLTMAPSDSPTLIPSDIDLFTCASIGFPPRGSPADSKSPEGFASPDRSGFAVFTGHLAMLRRQ